VSHLSDHPVEAAEFAVAFICGALMFAFALSPKARVLQRWARNGFAILAITVVTWSTLITISTFCSESLSKLAAWRVDRARLWVGGFAVGLFLALVISGEFGKLLRKAPAAGSGPGST
jgi:hypothetical protein